MEPSRQTWSSYGPPYPLGHWSSVMHKSLGQTLDKAVIDLGPKEACTGLTFVCLSRAKRIVDLIVEPMSTTQL